MERPWLSHPSAAHTTCRECHAPPPSHLMMHFAMVDQARLRRAFHAELLRLCQRQISTLCVVIVDFRLALIDHGVQ